MKQDPNPRHRRITLRILELAYGPGLTPEARECLAREFFRNFVLFAWETLELKAYEETQRCLLAQQFTDRIETLDVVADGFKYHCDRNAE